ncbi:HNH endonuclease [Vibrio cholerae]|uniref:HNH endonuclease n=1 Tax=Vibrio cholerae TaxID=666 RepID=UPI00115BC397|nr:HNH endonuclease [Vibrio cholerae]TQP08727.1 HNH endonuclease [Vibrio cholerae]TQP30218.1 HNH endonuclease [Vibrio cholerae]
MNLDERLEYFNKNYDILCNKFLGSGRNEYIGSKGLPCRFCGKNKPDVTFRTITHAVPEFLGNKQLILRNECDACNEFFSNNLEDHLDKYTKPYRTAAQIKGKRKVPSNKSKDKRTRFDFKPGDKSIIVSPKDSELADIDVENKTLTYKFEIEPHIPAAVYKCLVKIGLSVIEESELNNFEHTIRWILTKDHSVRFLNPLLLTRSFVPGPRPNRKLVVLVLKKRDLISIKPSYLLVVGFGNVVFQLILPSSLDTLLSGNKIPSITMPLPFEKHWPYGVVKSDIIDLSSHMLLRDKVIPMKFYADSIVELPELKGKSIDEVRKKKS